MKTQNEIKEILDSFLPETNNQLIALGQLIDSIEYTNKISHKIWSVTLYSNMFRLNVGRIEVLVVSNDMIMLNCLGEYGKQPFIGDEYEESGYKSVHKKQCRYFGEIKTIMK
jgi:hypothetical protein